MMTLITKNSYIKNYRTYDKLYFQKLNIVLKNINVNLIENLIVSDDEHLPFQENKFME